MELKQLQYFVVSVDMGSLSRAAEILYTTQPHISKTIKQLEKELDMLLLERTPTGVSVTPDGKQVYEYARRILNGMQHILNIRQEQDTPKLQLSAMPNQAFAQLFASYFAAQPHLFAKLQDGSLEQVLHQVSHHQVNLGFIFVSSYQQQALKNKLRQKRLTFQPLLQTQHMLFVGAQHPYYTKKKVAWSDLQKIRYVQYQEDDLSLLHHIGHVRGNLVNQQALQVAVTVQNDHMMTQLLQQTALASIGCCLPYPTAADTAVRAIPIETSLDNQIQFGVVKRSIYLENTEEQRFLVYVSEKLGIPAKNGADD